jgi:hypothetical protein
MHATQQPATGPDPTPADTFLRAADHLERHGWTQGAYYADYSNDTPPACVVGALAIAAYGYPHPDPHCDGFEPDDAVADSWHRFVTAEHHLHHYLGLRPIDPDSTDPETLYDWNDEDTRTGAEVIATLRAAAADYPGGAA